VAAPRFSKRFRICVCQTALPLRGLFGLNRERGLAESTIQEYCLYTQIFLHFIRGNAFSIESVEPKDLEAYGRVIARMYANTGETAKRARLRAVPSDSGASRNLLRFRSGGWPPERSPAILGRFEQHLQALRHRPTVIVHYMRATKRFLSFLEKHGLAVETVRRSSRLATEYDGPNSDQQYWRAMFNFRMRDCKVVRFMPRRAAAPFGPPTWPFASSRALMIACRSAA
jgi:hypothetical protein